MFDFNFFTSQDNQNIRCGFMRADADKIKGIILLLNGRTEFMEKYTQAASHLCSIGYYVMSLDWRGQGLSVRELDNRDKGYVKNFNLYLSDLKIFYNLHVLPLSASLELPVMILAHSMGGHIALRFLSEYPQDVLTIKKALLISPMVDIITSPINIDFADKFIDSASRLLAHVAVTAGLEDHYIIGGRDYRKEDARFEGNVLTHDWDNFWLEHKEIAKNRNLAVGGVTWGWIKAAFDSIATLKREKYLSKIKTPVSILSAEQDRVVSNSAQKRVCKIIPNGKFILIPGARHEILFETEEIRKELWSIILSELDSCFA